MSIDQHVSVTVTINNAGIAQEGFGTIAIPTYKNLFSGRSATYRRLADVIADGFDADSPEALAVGSVLSQSPHPPTVKLIKGLLPPTLKYTVECTDVRDGETYEMNVKGEGVTATTVEYESDDSAATKEQVHAGLVTELNAVVGNNYVAAFAALVYADKTFTAAASDVVTIAAHGLKTGDGPFRLTTDMADLPLNLLTATDYYIIRIDANTLYFATSLANALAGTAFDIGDAGTGVHTISDVGGTVRPSDPFTVTADAAGDWFSLEPVDHSAGSTRALAIAQTMADPGIATDLTNIYLADKDWYYLYMPWHSEAIVLATAAWIEATPFKAYMADLVDTSIESTAASSGDVADQLADLNYKRTHYTLRRKPNQMYGAGLAARLAPLPVGSWTAAYKTVVGSTADDFTATEEAHLEAKRCNYYKSEAGRSISWEGKVGNTDYGFLDVVVALDFVVDLIQKRVFGLKVALNKVAYTDEDIAQIAGVVEGVLDLCKGDKHKIVAPGTPGSETDPPPSVSFPKVKDIDPSVRALRELPDGNVAFRIQGAVHKTFIDLTVSF